LKVHKNTVYRLVSRGQLPAFKVSHGWRFDLELIDQWRLAQQHSARFARGDELFSRDGNLAAERF
jgi:excisionase family DNA binding protein